MKLAVPLALAAAFAFSPLGVRAQTVATPPPASLSVGGDATLDRDPDIARVNVEITTNDDDAARATGKNTTIYDALKERVRALGLPATALRTTFFNVAFIPYPPKGLPPEQRQPRYGYVASRNVTITVAPIEKAGKVVDAATAAGVTQAGDVSYDLADRRGAYREALAAAMADARKNAATLASAGDFSLGRIRTVSTDGETFAPRPFGGAQMRALAVAAPAPPPTDLGSAGPISIFAHVNVVYDIR